MKTELGDLVVPLTIESSGAIVIILPGAAFSECVSAI